MDLYGDLPLAKGASKAPTPSVWTQTLSQQQQQQPKANGPSSAASKSPAFAKPRVALAFQPMSIKRRTGSNHSIVKSAAAMTKSVAAPVVIAERKEEPKTFGVGLGVSSTTEVRIPHEQLQVPVAEGAAGMHFFQATYRDEYNPARPNSYEAFCEERDNKKKLEQVKRELDRRQREQDEEGQREREKLARDLEAGMTPTMDLPTAGRGRGMTVPAWMRKKIEENASRQSALPAASGPTSALENVSEADQFEDAPARVGLGFAQGGIGSSSSCGAGLGLKPTQSARSSSSRSRQDNDLNRSNVELDEFGRERPRQNELERRDHRRSRDRDRSQERDGRRSRDRYSRDDRGRDQPLSKNREEFSRHDSRPQRSETNISRPSDHREESSRGYQYATQRAVQRVIMLQNMVGPGEVDDELQDEVKEECSSKYGPVDKCLVYEITTRVRPEEAVRLFVKFQRAGDADKALQGLNGRFFGGRKVRATYYDEHKFDRSDLSS